jgi:peptidoglycan-N-acetylmuramic acid deacetylase
MFRTRDKVMIVLTALALFVAGSVWLYVQEDGPAAQTAGEAAVSASAADWGLSFQTEGQAPIGNATAEDLAQYGAYYLGDTSEKVIYLTFDCGYENGYTEAILDALKKHSAPAASSWWATCGDGAVIVKLMAA